MLMMNILSVAEVRAQSLARVEEMLGLHGVFWSANNFAFQSESEKEKLNYQFSFSFIIY